MALPLPPVPVNVAGFATNEGFVGFNFAGEQSEPTFSQSEAKTMSHEPSGLLGYAQVASELTGANSILAINHEPQSGKPLLKAER